METPATVAAVVLETLSGELILQIRDSRPEGAAHLRGKTGFFGGHLDAGEGPIESAIRELREELELELEANDLENIGLYQKVLHIHGDNNFIHVLRYRQPVDPTTLVLHEGRGIALINSANTNRQNLAPFAKDTRPKRPTRRLQNKLNYLAALT